MDWSKFALVFTGFYVNLIFPIFAICIDRFFVLTAHSGDLIHIGGTIGLIVGAIAFLYFYVANSKGTGPKSWEFYTLIFPIFLTSCLNQTTALDFTFSPNEWIFPSYVHSGDVVLESYWLEAYIYLSGLFFHLNHYIVLYNYQNGKSWRSLILLTTSAFFVIIVGWIPLAATSTGPSSLLTKFLFIYIPIVVYWMIAVYRRQKSFTFRKVNKNQTFLSQANALDFVTFTLMTSSLVLIFAKFLVSIGISFGPLEWVEDADPMILSETVPNAIPAGITHSWLNLVTVAPSFAICLSHMLSGGKKQEFLWDLGIIQTAFLLITQSYSLYGSLHSDLPHDIRPSRLDPVFLAINLIPVVAALLYLEHLSRDRLDTSKSSQGRKKVQ